MYIYRERENTWRKIHQLINLHNSFLIWKMIFFCFLLLKMIFLFFFLSLLLFIFIVWWYIKFWRGSKTIFFKFRSFSFIVSVPYPSGALVSFLLLLCLLCISNKKDNQSLRKRREKML